MQGYKQMGLTGFNFLIGDKSVTATGGRDSMSMWECCFPEPSITRLLPYWDVPCSICHFPGMRSSVFKSSPNVVSAAPVAISSICGLTTAGTFNVAVQYFISYTWCKTQDCGCSVEAHFQDEAGSMSLFFSSIKAANTSNKDNRVPQWIFGN